MNVHSLLFDVMTLDEKDLLGDLELLVLVMMLQAVFRKDIAERIMTIYLELRPKLHEPRFRRLWEDCMHYAITSAKNFTYQEALLPKY